jgi:hypothetical protein
MSNLVSAAVMGSRRRQQTSSLATGTRRVVMIVLSDQADDDGYTYGAISSIGWKAGLSDDTVRRAIIELEEQGELYIIHTTGYNTGQWRVNQFLITVHLTFDELVEVLQQRFKLSTSEAIEIATEITKRLNSREIPALYGQEPEGIESEKIDPPPSSVQGAPSQPARESIYIPKQEKQLTPSQSARGSDDFVANPLDDLAWGEWLNDILERDYVDMLEHIPFDNQGNLIEPVLYDPNSVFFRLITEQLRPFRRKLIGSQRSAWIDLIKKTRTDVMFGRWMIWLAFTNAKGQSVPVFLRFCNNLPLYDQWCRGEFKAITEFMAGESAVTKGLSPRGSDNEITLVVDKESLPEHLRDLSIY